MQFPLSARATAIFLFGSASLAGILSLTNAKSKFASSAEVRSGLYIRNPISTTPAMPLPQPQGGCGASCPEDCYPYPDIGETDIPIDYCSYPGSGCPDGLIDDGTGSGCCASPESPILIDLSGSNFALTEAPKGVWFDLDNSGVPQHLSWTPPEANEGWLAVDRNGNGAIDDGAELFGNHTPQPASPHPNGFLALAEYDKPANGGNGDGIIDARDAIFSQLRIWIDGNHDGISQPGELHSLSELGIISISLDYKESRRIDQFGNQFRYRSVVIDRRGASHWAWDVFLKAE